MWFEQFIKGVLIGLMATVPLGPIGVFVVQRTLTKNHISGFISGMGAVLADAIFASIALLSLSMVIGFINNHIALIKVIGGICVIMVGMTIMLKNPIVQIKRNRAGMKNSLWSDFLSMFFIAIANPLYILIFVALFAAFGVSYMGTAYFSTGMMLLGVVSGATAWWVVLTTTVGLLRSKFRPRHLLWMNRISGAVIVFLGAAVIISIFVNIPVNVFPQ